MARGDCTHHTPVVITSSKSEKPEIRPETTGASAQALFPPDQSSVRCKSIVNQIWRRFFIRARSPQVPDGEIPRMGYAENAQISEP